jgi:esterase/lipase superfamily enzyme
MFFISSRVKLNNEDAVGGADTYWDISTNNDGIEVRRNSVTQTHIENLVKDKNVMVLVHGYNNEFEDVVRAYHTIEKMTLKIVKNQYDVILGYTWPGGDSALDWYRPKRRAGVIAPRFAANLKHLTKHASNVDVNTHSLGARVCLKGLESVPKNRVRNVFLIASAIDNESIEKGEDFHTSTKKVAFSGVFHSKHDKVLRIAYRSAEWDRALGHSGPEDTGDIIQHSPNVKVYNCKKKVRAHGKYKYHDDVYKAIKAICTNPTKIPQFSTL